MEKISTFYHVCLAGEMKKWADRKMDIYFLCLVEKKIERKKCCLYPFTVLPLLHKIKMFVHCTRNNFLIIL